MDLWKHEEGLRQQRNTVLLGTNAFLAIAASALISAQPPIGIGLVTGLVLAVFGYESWEKQWEALRSPPDPSPVSVDFRHTGARFSPQGSEKSAIVTESLLPRAIAVAWGLFALGAIALDLLS